MNLLFIHTHLSVRNNSKKEIIKPGHLGIYTNYIIFYNNI